MSWRVCLAPSEELWDIFWTSVFGVIARLSHMRSSSVFLYTCGVYGTARHGWRTYMSCSKIMPPCFLICKCRTCWLSKMLVLSRSLKGPVVAQVAARCWGTTMEKSCRTAVSASFTRCRASYRSGLLARGGSTRSARGSLQRTKLQHDVLLEGALRPSPQIDR